MVKWFIHLAKKTSKDASVKDKKEYKNNHKMYLPNPQLHSQHIEFHYHYIAKIKKLNPKKWKRNILNLSNKSSSNQERMYSSINYLIINLLLRIIDRAFMLENLLVDTSTPLVIHAIHQWINNNLIMIYFCTKINHKNLIWKVVNSSTMNLLQSQLNL